MRQVLMLMVLGAVSAAAEPGLTVSVYNYSPASAVEIRRASFEAAPRGCRHTTPAASLTPRNAPPPAAPHAGGALSLKHDVPQLG